MNKKASYILLALGISLAITGCKTKLDEKKEVETVVEQDQKIDEKDRDKQPEEKKTEDQLEDSETSTKKEEKLLLERYYSDDAIKDSNFKYVYDDESESNERTVITPSFDVKIDLIALEYKDDKLVEKELIQTYDLANGEKLLLKAVYPEGIPMLKLKWTVDKKTDEFILEYNGKDGGPDRLEFKY